MVARDGRILLSVLLIAGLIGWAGVSQLSSIGIRIVLPFTGEPFLVGIEATTNLSFGLGTGSFLLDSAGRTLIAVGVDIDLGEEGSSARTYLRLTTGIYYFDPSRSFPSPLIGGGDLLPSADLSTARLRIRKRVYLPARIPRTDVLRFGRVVV